MIELTRDLSRRLSVAYVLDDKTSFSQLRQCILAGSLDRLYVGVGIRNELISVKSRHTPYRLGDGCVVQHVPHASLLVGDLRTITPRNAEKEAFTILEHATQIEVDDLYAAAKLRPEVLVLVHEQFEVGGQSMIRDAVRLFGVYTVWQKITPLYPPKKKEIVPGVTTADFFDAPRRSLQKGKRRR